ncbi:MAG: hypothetical protein KY429_01395 [Actinobacteria bacterium]|nr:hypothetical protein [Actinomycetota bacterium]
MRIILVAVCIGLLGLSACQTTTQTVTPEATVSATPASPSIPAGSCVGVSGGTDGVLMYVTDVRVGTHPGYDRITFEFTPAEGSPAALPRYELSPVQPPFTYDPSDMPMEVEGETFLHVLFHGATGVKMEGDSPEQTYTGPREMKPDHPSLVEAELQGDFEATLAWMLGLSVGTCWAVVELDDPTRLVIDFPHRSE